MTDSERTTIQWILAAGFVLAGFAFARRRRAALSTVAPQAGEKYPNTEAFAAIVSRLGESSTAGATFLERAKELYERYLATLKGLDDKAAAMLGFVGGGTGLLAIAAGTDKVARPSITPLLCVAVIYLFAVLVCVTFVQTPRRLGSLDIEILCTADLLASNAGKARMDAMTGREYVEVARSYYPVIVRKGAWLALAQAAFAFGIAAVVVNLLLLPPPAAAESHKALCAFTDSTITCELQK